jgi:hypothetical protein
MTSCCIWDYCRPACPADNFKGEAIALTPFEIINSSQATSIIQDFSVEMEKKHKLHMQQAKTYYDGGIHAMQLEFISQNIIGMCEARKLIVEMVENLLGKLNQDPILAKDIANYPFRPSNLEIYITFESYFGKYVDPFYVRWICMEDGTVDYYEFDLDDNTKNKWHARHEAYATSREIVVYQLEAERKYEEVNNPKVNVFGNQRYFPKDEQASQ